MNCLKRFRLTGTVPSGGWSYARKRAESSSPDILLARNKSDQRAYIFTRQAAQNSPVLRETSNRLITPITYGEKGIAGIGDIRVEQPCEAIVFAE